MKKLTNVMIFAFIFLFLLNIDMTKVVANEENVGYSVRAIIPDNQINQDITYFDLRVKPNQKQIIYVELFNSSKEDMEIEVHITNPITNRNGLIDYTNINAKLDESLKVPMTEIAKVEEKTVYLPAGDSKIIPIELNIPEEQFDGIILGGIYFEKRIDDSEKNKNGVQILNKYAYVIGLKLSESDKEIEPALKLKSIKPDLVNYHPAIIASIQNTAPAIVGNLVLNAIVYNSKGKEETRVDAEDFRMAPNSTMEFTVDWQNRELKPGKYKLSLHANVGTQNWEWEEEFVIPKVKAEVINETAVEIKKDYTTTIVISFSLIIFILICIIGGLIRKNKRLKEN